MEDRAQVILIMTGLGATPLEKALPGSERVISSVRNSPATAVEASRSTPPKRNPEPVVPQTAEQEYETAATDLDIPAFIRKRAHYNQL